MTEPRTQCFSIPDIGPSSNEFFGRMHPQKRRRLVHQWHKIVWVCARNYDVPKFTTRVDLTIECHFGPKRADGRKRIAFDSSNCSATLKLIEDGLVEVGILKGDSPKYVRWVKMLSVPRQAITQTLVTIAEV